MTSITKGYKFQVMELDCINHDVEILYTTGEYPKALEFLSSHLVKTYELDSYLKCYFESKNSVCIFKANYLFPGKQLLSKIQIKSFTDEL